MCDPTINLFTAIIHGMSVHILSLQRCERSFIDFDDLFCNGLHAFSSADMVFPSANDTPLRNQMAKCHCTSHKIGLMDISRHTWEYLMAMGLRSSYSDRIIEHKNCRSIGIARKGD